MRPNDFKQKRNGFHFSEATGLTQYGKRKVDTALSAFTCLFDEILSDQILRSSRSKNKEETVFALESWELLRFVGVLLARSLFSEQIPVRHMWSAKFGVPYIAKFMAKSRFEFILKYLSFSEEATLSVAVIRGVLQRFAANSAACFAPNKWLSVDDAHMLPRLPRSDPLG